MLTSAPPSPPPPKQTQRITGNAFRISLQPDWQIDNGFFKRGIMARTQILYTGGAQNKDFCVASQTDLTRSLVPSVAQASEMTGHYR